MTANLNVDGETAARLYRKLRLIRRTEEEVARIYPSDKIKSPVHLSIGQEFISTGVCDVLNGDDVVSATYRGHAAYLAKGGDLKGMIAEMYGKAGGCAGGKAGSMHLIDMGHNILGMSAVVGTTIPVASGYALAMKREGKRRIVVCFFGDGAVEEGVFSETLNFASLHKLPVLFVCENNGYAIHACLKERWATEALCERVETYAIPTRQVNDGNVFSVRQAAEEAVAAIRAGEGPRFIECKAYRWREHVGPEEDFDAGYRERHEMAPWLANDQMEKIGGQLPAKLRQTIDAEVETTIAEAVDFAENSPWPQPDELHTHVHAG